jgi:cytochrome c-type biogenesis protein CcsB
MYGVLRSPRTMMLLLFVLGFGAACGTFIENDFGTLKAREFVYNSIWYESVLFLSAINLCVILYENKSYKVLPRFIFHSAFVIILIGAALTRYFGYEGIMSIREGDTSNTFLIKKEALHVESKLPFSIHLVDFKLERYPGSKSPSDYSSDIKLIDTKNNITFNDTIYMNNTFNYQGYKFFQTSYDLDEGGTILTVNKDPGKITTYIGYFLLFLGLILNFFDKKSRFYQLTCRIKKMQLASISLLLFTVCNTPVVAQDSYMQTYLEEHAKNSKVLANELGSLVVQSRMGRMKPLDTLNSEIIYKLSGKNTLYGMNHNQIILGMFSRPKIWQKVELIKIKSPQLKKLLGVDEDKKLISFAELFTPQGTYKLEKEVEKAIRIMPAFRNTYEKDVIKVDELTNISFMVFRGSVLKIFPLEDSQNNQWIDFKNFWESAKSTKAKKVQIAAERLLNESFNRNYDKALPYVKTILDYQKEYGKDVIPSQEMIKNEILLNKAKIFPRLTPVYVLFGLILFIYSFASLFFKKLNHKKIRFVIIALATLLFCIHTFGMGARWYISGHAPMSDTYESIVYIAWSAMLAGVVFFRKSIFALSAAIIIAGIFMFAAHLGHIDPEITNLVPVLKSFWLSVHVSIITSSYGFLGLGAVLGFMNLILFILRTPKKEYLDTHIKNITDINEAALSIGLALLVIGNFLGGIWANESWGRYWGWDPKETWSYIAIIVYAIVLHLRMLKDIYTPYLFNVFALVSFASILMTYFGVNFYLAGMHSYATGDPVPIPTWVYALSVSIFLLIALAYPKRKILENYN